MVIVAAFTVGDVGAARLRRAKPNVKTTASTEAKTPSGSRAARHWKPCSHTALTAEANHMTRKVRPYIPVTETSCMSGRTPYCE